MAVMLEKLYDALLAAKVPDEKARAAAIEIAAFEKPLPDFSQFATKADLAGIREEMAALRSEMATKAELRSGLATIRAEISAEVAAVRRNH
jgi:hypothetical protein